ncbi:hypothetical protein DK308_15580, partial [Listeria monocytogenes]|uniref:hypothetical protein n=1 Tax=Listeria monocytogenes TaxID=1639 RepID=UPI000D8F8738
IFILCLCKNNIIFHISKIYFYCHIIDRSDMPNGGYVKSNGITLCSEHHLCAEQFHITGTAIVNFHPDDLFKIINSSYEQAYKDSLKL